MATDLNHVVLVGRLTKDLGADERSFGYVGNGQARATVSIAVNRSRKGADGNWIEEANFFDVTIWGKSAENLKPYLTKGKQIAVDGYDRIQNPARFYDDSGLCQPLLLHIDAFDGVGQFLLACRNQHDCSQDSEYG